MINRLDTSGTHQQMVSHFTAFSKARKVHSEYQCPDSKQAPDQHLEDNRGDGTSTSDSSETRDPIAHKSDSGSTAWKLQQSQFQNAQEKGRGNTPPQQVPQKVTLTEKGTVDATVHHPPPPPPSLLPRLPLTLPVLPVAATHTKESTSTATTGPGDTLRRTTTQYPLQVPLFYLEACKITSDEVNLLCLISYYSLKMYCPPPNLAE